MDRSLHIGQMGDGQNLTINWLDENGVTQKTDIKIEILACDKPRVLSVSVDGEIVKLVVPKHKPTNIRPGEWRKVP